MSAVGDSRTGEEVNRLPIRFSYIRTIDRCGCLVEGELVDMLLLPTLQPGPNWSRPELLAERLQGYGATVDREASTVRADIVLDIEVYTALQTLVGSVGCLCLESADHRVENPHLCSPVRVSDTRITINLAR